MSEKTPEQVPPATAARDAALFLLARSGWANQSDGDKDSPGGWFAAVSNSAVELPEIVEIFQDDLTAVGLTDPNELLGHFILTEKADGAGSVYQFWQEQEVLDIFGQMARAYAEWRE